MPLRYFGDQVLRRHAADVPDITGDLVDFGRTMLVTMDHEDGIGLAAPLFLMMSGGGLTTIETACRFPIRLVESGPGYGTLIRVTVPLRDDREGG